jgi:cytoskeleton protein RodZ
MAESIGQRLKQAREDKKLSIEEASHATRIKPHYLRAIEADDMEVLPSQVQGRGFLRLYADFLAVPLVEKSPEQPTHPLQSPQTPITAIAQPGEQPLDTDLEQNPPEINQVFISPAPALAPVAPQLPSQVILAEIGQTLKQRREALSLTLESVEKLTHLRLIYLQALEAGHLNELPSPVQGRGMLNNYALFLNLDAERILLRYADALQEQRIERMGKQPSRKPPINSVPQSRIRTFLTTDVLLTSVLVLSMLGFVVWAASKLLDLQQDEAMQPTLPGVSEILSGSTPSPQLVDTQVTELTPATTSLAVTPVEGTLDAGSTLDGQAATEPVVVGQGPIMVSIIPRLRAWVRVTVDGDVVFNGRILPGNAYIYAGSERVEVLCGNGAAIRLLYNQVDLGSLGSTGQVVNLIFTQEGQILPTPAITPSPTTKPQPTLTPPLTSPQATPTPSLAPES